MEIQQGVGDMDMKQLFFNNLVLLGLDTAALEAQTRIPFNKSMFNLPNKTGAETILHFLFQRLNPTLCADMFRNCWPVLDKKREQEFRKTCHNWLSGIAQEEPDCHLPRINASLFMTPGGDKFCQLLLYFSGYVLQKVLNAELGNKSVEQLKHPQLTSQNVSLADVMQKNLSCSSIRLRQQYFDMLPMTIKARKTWKKAADGSVREYRKLNKEVRELEYKLRAQQQRAFEASQARGSPVKRRDRADDLDPDFDPRTIKRAQRIQQVRDMWKQMDGFENSLASEREIVESIVERTVNKYVLDAADISVKVPDMLLRECEAEIRRRNVDNTYQGGRLNLVSVLQLWNLSLHLYLEKLNQVGVPQFEEEVKKLVSQVHVQQTYQHNNEALKHQMEEVIPNLKESIEKLREHLDNEFFQETTPNTIRSTSVGLSVLDPSPELNFSPKDGTPPPGLNLTTSQGDAVETPEGASRITTDVKSSVRPAPRQLFNADLLNKDNKQLGKPSSIPSSRHSSRPTSARSTADSKGGKKTIKKPTSKLTKSGPTVKREDEEFVALPSPRTMVGSLDTTPQPSAPLSVRSDKSSASDKTLTPRSKRSYGSPVGSTVWRKVGQAQDVSPRSDRSRGHSDILSPRSQGQDDILSPRSDRSRGQGDIMSPRIDGLTQGRQTPTDYLVAEILGEEKIPSPFNSGLEAFENREIVRRTPDLEENDSTLIPSNSVSYSAADAGDVNINASVDDTPDDACETDEEEHKEKQAYVNVVEDRSVEIEEVLGPELEGEYDNEGDDNLSDSSDRSQEQIIVIDRSIIHQSPKVSPKVTTPVTDSYSFDTYPEDVELLEDEEFPCLEDSPRQSIIIDKSINYNTTTPKTGNQFNTSGLQFPGHQLSPSFHSQTLPEDEERRGSISLMSRSLGFEKSPLSSEIRRMFKEAISDTTPNKPVERSRIVDVRCQLASSVLEQADNMTGLTGQNTTQAVKRKGLDSDSELEMPDMDPESRTLETDSEDVFGRHVNRPLKSSEMIWDDQVENIDDIEMPDFDMDQPLGQDEESGQLTPDRDHRQSLLNEEPPSPLRFVHTSGLSPSALSPLNSPRMEECSADIDEFFATKTPELPKLRMLQGTLADGYMSPTGELSPPGGSVNSENLIFDGDVDMNMFSPPKSLDEGNSPLISFTP